MKNVEIVFLDSVEKILHNNIDRGAKMKNTLGSRITGKRKSFGLSQAEFGNLVGFTRFTVAKWEKDEKSPTLKELEDIAAALGTTTAYLLGHELPSSFEPNTDQPYPADEMNDDDSSNQNDKTTTEKGRMTAVGPRGTDSDNGISPESFAPVMVLPMFNYSELSEGGADMKIVDFAPLPASIFPNCDAQRLYAVRQNIPFRMVAEGRIPENYFAIASRDFDFSNNKIYLVSIRGRILVRRVTEHADGSVDISSDEGSQFYTAEEKEAMNCNLVARIIGAAPDGIIKFE